MLTSEHTARESEQKARKVMGMLKRGIKFTPTQSDVMATLAGSILALKIWTGTNTRAFLKNMDNKSLKKQRKTAGSSYPPRSLNSRQWFISTRRNPVLTAVFNRLGYMNRKGDGFGKTISGYEFQIK